MIVFYISRWYYKGEEHCFDTVEDNEFLLRHSFLQFRFVPFMRNICNCTTFILYKSYFTLNLVKQS